MQLGYKVKQGFIEDLNIPDNSKDMIILLGTIEHAYDLNKAMNECVRILKSNGLIFIRWRSDKLWGSPIEYFNSNHYNWNSNIIGMQVPSNRWSILFLVIKNIDI